MACSALLAVAVAGVPSPAHADRCAALAKAKTFDPSSAMLAVFCEYDAAHGGTLLPVKYTKGWQAESASVLATPLLVATYRDGSILKGVLAVQRQELENGEPMMGHAMGAMVSVYVFCQRDGVFVFEKGAREAFTAGAHGTAPGGRLMRIGTERYGMWFEGGDVHQGYTNDYALVVSLSDPSIVVLGTFDTGASNRGACSANPDDGLEPCWGYEGKPGLISRAGDDYAVLRIRYSGTEKPDDLAIRAKNVAVCYARRGDKYQAVDERDCDQGEARPSLQPFGVEESVTSAQPMPTVPRKLLK